MKKTRTGKASGLSSDQRHPSRSGCCRSSPSNSHPYGCGIACDVVGGRWPRVSVRGSRSTNIHRTRGSIRWTKGNVRIAGSVGLGQREETRIQDRGLFGRRCVMRDLFYLSETQFRRIKPYFPLSHGVPQVDDLRVIAVPAAREDECA